MLSSADISFHSLTVAFRRWQFFMDYQTDIFKFIKSEENNFLNPIQLEDGWDWSFKKHIRLSSLYFNGQFSTGNSETERDYKPFKNITRPILNLAFRAEGFDVKDIVLFLNDKVKYFKSFLVRKYHEVWARENSLDTFIDDMVETYVVFGGVLVKNVNQVKPEVVPMQSIVFCDQTDILSGPIGLKHFYSPDQLKEMESVGWGREENRATATIEELITLCQNYKVKDSAGGQKNKTPGKYIEIYEVHGCFPQRFIEGESDDYTKQLHIVAYYKNDKNEDVGVTLFKGKEKELPFKLLLRSKIYGRALGMGGAEELFEPQVWINDDQIRIKGMLDQAAKVINITTDGTIVARHPSGMKNMEHGEIVELAEGKEFRQMDTTPRNITIFENSVSRWEEHARQMGAATESIMGESPTAGTPFKLQELITSESHSLHEYRKGQLATFLGEIYRDWIIPYIAKEVSQGQEFIATLDLEELQTIAENLVSCQANYYIKEKILNGEMPDPQEIEQIKQDTREAFMKGGNKRFIEILKDELKGIPIDVEVNIVGKQKNLAGMVDKMTNVFKTIIANPGVLQSPPMAKLFNQILESSGLNPLDFSGFTVLPPQGQEMPQQQMQSPTAIQPKVATI